MRKQITAYGKKLTQIELQNSEHLRNTTSSINTPKKRLFSNQAGGNTAGIGGKSHSNTPLLRSKTNRRAYLPNYVN